MGIRSLLLVSPHDHQGGAARIAWYLFYGYRKMGYNSHFAVGKKSLEDSGITQVNHTDYMVPRWWWKFRKAWDITLGIENFNFPGTLKIPSIPANRPDIIHVHNLQGKYFDLRALPEMTAQYPVLLTLHDTWMFSGHCAYFMDCQRWKEGCGNCPDLKRTPTIQRDATSYNWRRKREIYQKARFFVAAPSQWLIDEMKSSMMMPAVLDYRVVNNGVDTSIFKPADKATLRREKGISEDAFVLLYVVSSQMKVNLYKDYDTIFETLEILKVNAPADKKIIFLGLGEGGETEITGNMEKRFIPYQHELKEIAKYYQLANLYLHAARAENFPNVILEALACGTPVVATDVGGIAEQIVEGVTGHLVKPRGAKEMAEKIVALIQSPELLSQMSINAAEDAVKRFSIDRMLNDYLRYYEDMLAFWQPDNDYSKAKINE